MDTVTRANLVDLLQRKNGFSRQEAMFFLETMLGIFSQTLEKGESLKISGFGTFSVRDKKPRIGRNPMTKREAVISARCVPFFRPSRFLRDMVNNKEC